MHTYLMDSFSRVPFTDKECISNLVGCPLIINIIAFVLSTIQVVMGTVKCWFPSFLEQNRTKTQNSNNTQEQEEGLLGNLNA